MQLKQFQFSLKLLSLTKCDVVRDILVSSFRQCIYKRKPLLQRRWYSVRCTLRGHPHGNKRTCFGSFWRIIHMDPVNALFWNLVSGWKNPKTLPLRSRLDGESAYFAYRWRHRPTPRPLTFDLWTPRRLITTTMVDHMLVFVLQNTLSLIGLLEQNIMPLCHYTERKKIMDNRLTIFIFFMLCSTVCLYTVCKLYVHALSLLLCFWCISSATYRPGIWTTACWVVFMDPFGRKYSWTMPRKTGGKRLLWYMWTWPKWQREGNYGKLMFL